jgi:hypothetical protein
MSDIPLIKPPEESPKRVAFGFNPRTETTQIEISQGRGPGNATTEKSYWTAKRSPYWYRGSDLTEPLEMR